MKVVDYKTVLIARDDQFATIVHRSLGEGWQPLGAPFTATLYGGGSAFCQAMVMYAPDDGTKAIAAWMVERGFVTGHGDTVADLLSALVEQVAMKTVVQVKGL